MEYFHGLAVCVSVTAGPWAAHLCSLSAALRTTLGALFSVAAPGPDLCLVPHPVHSRYFCSHPANCQPEPALRHSVSRSAFPEGESVHVGQSASPQNEPLLMDRLFFSVCPLSHLCEPGDSQWLMLGQERARPSQARPALARPMGTATLPLDGLK